ncbi:hypothetical protein [Allonocardiopsis opalescens]|uniref:Uncharacterized protein n=1 Tax=Allonocardiopsis opalescens TaxID=1144618 RepID=A0A2T0PXS6_9ACTN|nr:hypothetical protein [Allonocardiopsis opalescens]PRX96309.1 hypothetical protein CLV72_108316 [Allonocardiopsis opalescens]
MKEIVGLVGVLLVAQGVGGVVNRLAGDGPSWFLVNHVEFLRGYEIPAGVVLAVLGLVLAGTATVSGRGGRKEEEGHE